MTFDQIVATVAERLNLTSTAAIARIGVDVNEIYAKFLTSMGLEPSVRSTTTANTVVGNRYLEFPDTLKTLSVYNPNLPTPNTLGELTFDEMRNLPIGTDPAQNYALARAGVGSVTIFLDCIPATIYALGADIVEAAATMEDADEPNFPANFHDLLIMGAMAIELRKMEKYPLAVEREQAYEARCGDYRLFLAKSAYLDVYQGKRRGLYLWNIPFVR